MIDIDEGRLRDHPEWTFGAIVWMGAPANIGKQAGGVSQALLSGGLSEALMREQLVGPIDELQFVIGRAGVAATEIPT